ncbi:hypothetical protein AAF712_003730 [Marasmius tenuissimus]|uniref:F-box domain-containing protein n=1 Tax=Marasmius tenuissimus TaxID=585030 RepID=A0ABR3A508_9AGAR
MNPPSDIVCRLPPELIYKILSECTPQTLLLCSLVCRSWLSPCRSLYFNDHPLKIKSASKECEKLLSLLLSKTKCSIIPYLRFLHLDVYQLDLAIKKEILDIRDEESSNQLRQMNKFIELIHTLVLCLKGGQNQNQEEMAARASIERLLIRTTICFTPVLG